MKFIKRDANCWARGIYWRNVAIVIMLLFVLGVGGLCGLYWVGVRSVDHVKFEAQFSAHDAGFKIQGYEGYKWCLFHGGDVWYLFNKGNNGITYNGFFAQHPLSKEIHIYKLRALDALKGGR
jgi:hypothetical protein